MDGLLTNETGVTLATFYADCVPLFFVDPEHRAIALSHSGWRGTVNRMGRKTIERMRLEFGTDPGQLITAIGPSICQDCYEVSEDVEEAFEKAFPPEESAQILENRGGGKYQLDLWKANEFILLRAGIVRENLDVTDLCTCCNSDKLFSHRASHGKRGNLGCFIMIDGE